MKCYRIAHWNDRYEPRNPKHGKTQGPLRYVELRCHGLQMGVGFRMMKQAAGDDCYMVFGIFCKLLEVAACLPEGKRGWLLDHRHQPATIGYLAFALDFDKKQLTTALDILVKIGWLSYEEIDEKILTNCTNTGNGRGKPRQSGGIPPNGRGKPRQSGGIPPNGRGKPGQTREIPPTGTGPELPGQDIPGPEGTGKDSLSSTEGNSSESVSNSVDNSDSDSDCALEGSSSRFRKKGQPNPWSTDEIAKNGFPDPMQASGDEAGRHAAVMQLHLALGIAKISDTTRQRSEMGHIYALMDAVDVYCLQHHKAPRRKIYQQVVDLCREKMSYRGADNPRAVFYAACKQRWRQNHQARAPPSSHNS